MCFNLDWFRLIPSDSTYLGLIVCYSSVFSSFWYDVCWFDMLWANLSSLFLCDSMGIDSIWWGVVWFYSIWFDVISCDSVWFVLLWLNVIQCWFDSRDLVSSGVTRFNSMLLFDSISFVLFCLDALRCDSCLSICIWFNPIWFDSVSSGSSLVWFMLTRFYEVGVDSISFCLIQVPLMLVDVIRFERWWFYSIWFALIWFDLIRLTFCEHIYVSAMCLHFHMFYSISYLLARLAQNGGLAAPIMTFWALLIWSVVESESHIQRTLLKLIRNPICFLYELSHRRLLWSHHSLWSHLQTCEVIWSHLAHLELPGANWTYPVPLEPPGTIWSSLQSAGAIWSYLELSGGTCNWSHLEPSEDIWSHLEPSGGIWNHLERSQAIWTHLRVVRRGMSPYVRAISSYLDSSEGCQG